MSKASKPKSATTPAHALPSGGGSYVAKGNDLAAKEGPSVRRAEQKSTSGKDA